MAGRKDLLFKLSLFADQDLDDVVALMQPPPGPLAEAVARLREGRADEAEAVLTAEMITRPREFGGWHRLVHAAALQRRGNSAGAARSLQHLLDKMTESRIRLWAWRALRALGSEPPPDKALRVEGAIIEVDAGNGVETLAVYGDGTARYLLPTGARLLWEKPDGRLAAAIEAVIAAANAVAPALTEGRLPGEPGPDQARATLLTPGGPRVAEAPVVDMLAGGGPAAPLFAAATALLDDILAMANW